MQKLKAHFITWLEAHPIAKDLFLYYVKGIEDGPRIEKRMLKFQQKVQGMMEREGIALIAVKGPNEDISMSFVPEQKWDADKAAMEQKMVMEAMEQQAAAL